MTPHEKKIELFELYAPQLSILSTAVSAGGITERQWKHIEARFARGVERGSVIGFVDTSATGSGKTGYLFTDEKVCYLEVLEKPQKLWYDEIAAVAVDRRSKPKDTDRVLLITQKDGPRLEWTSTFLNKTPLQHLFQALLSLEPPPVPAEARLGHEEPKTPGADAAGLGLGAFSGVNKGYDEEKFHANQGHGFAAERANDLVDKLTGHKAKLLGDDNAKDGPDRLVDGVYIQSKYCATGQRCVNECFDKDGRFRYLLDGKPMQIEVPSDQYEAAVGAMEEKIENGQVPGVTDKAEARTIIRKGHFTYQQARNIAKAGTVESLAYDAVHGVIYATSAFGVSALLTFAASVWSGEEVEVSLKRAAASGLKVGGTTFLTTLLAGQLSKAGLNSALVGASEAVVRLMGPKAAAVLINAFRVGAKPIYGAAAMKSAAKLLRGNVITACVTVAVLSSFDIVNIFRGRISGRQLLKNLANTAGTVAGGSAGWLGGAAIGTAFLPGPGTLIGALIGSLAAGGLLGKVMNTALGKCIEDDADQMVRILQREFGAVSEEYLLSRKEAEKCVDRLGEQLSGKLLRDMFASEDRAAFARRVIVPIVERQVSHRARIAAPSEEDMLFGLRTLLEDLSDEAPA